MSRKPHKYWLARPFLVKQLLKMGLYNKMFDLTNSPAKKEAKFCLLPQKLFPGRISPRSCKAGSLTLQNEKNASQPLKIVQSRCQIFRFNI